MKAGRFFKIPERPSELRELWGRGWPLELTNLPEWLSNEDASYYRLLASVSVAGLRGSDLAAFQAEVDEMHVARLIVDSDPRAPHLHRVYIAAPLTEPVWSIGVYRGRSPLELAPAHIGQPVLTAEHVTDVSAAFVADPFWIRRADRWYMFFEVMNWRANKGEIGLATSHDGFNWRYEQIVLAEEFHLSYPYVFAVNGEIYMVPESFQNNSVRLYRARRFPDDWEHAGNLLSGGYYADSSPFFHNGNWWLFAESSAEADDTLRLFCADHLLGPWREHPRSPIVRGDASCSRPAGRIVAMPHKLFRFAQNCSTDYGRDVRALEIVRLTKSDYEEKAVSATPLLGPTGRGWNARGMHHIDALQLATDGWIAAVDGWHLSHDVPGE